MSKLAPLFLLITFASSLNLAQEAKVSFGIDSKAGESKTNELRFVVGEGHHFNKDAPNKVEVQIDGTWVRSKLINMDRNILTAKWEKSLDPCEGVRAQLFVCDNKNTYCLPRSESFKCENEKWVSSVWRAGAPEVSPRTFSNEAYFILNDSNQALKLAHESRKPILIDFFGIWCPPCNELDETVFKSQEFNAVQSQFVLLKLDADSSASWALKSKYRITGYPTVIFADENGDEISRLVGFRPKSEFVASMRDSLKNKDGGLEAKKAKAEENDSVAYQVGLMLLDREQFYQAHYYLVKASRHWRITDMRRNKLMSAQLGLYGRVESVEDRRAYEKLLVRALEWYPRQVEVFERADSLASLSEELGDKEVNKKAQQTRIETALWYLGHPKALKGTEFIAGDLYEILGSAYETIDEKQKALDAFASGAKEYLKEIKKSALDENLERGYNLERIYCLWKSGQVDLARDLYTHFEKQFPQEFTFYYQHGKLLSALKLYKEAEEKAQKAYDYSYGDNRLRVAAFLAETLSKSKDQKKAVEFLDSVIKSAQLPEDKTIRTHVYYAKLVDLRKKLTNGQL